MFERVRSPGIIQDLSGESKGTKHFGSLAVHHDSGHAGAGALILGEAAGRVVGLELCDGAEMWFHHFERRWGGGIGDG